MKTHDLSPSHNYIIGSHPHGILCVGAFCNFITGSTGFEELFPGICSFLTTLAGNFRLPVFREYLMSGGERCLPCPARVGLPRAPARPSPAQLCPQCPRAGGPGDPDPSEGSTGGMVLPGAGRAGRVLCLHRA